MADSNISEHETAEEMMERIAAEKGPRPYKGGLNEETWEEVCVLSEEILSLSKSLVQCTCGWGGGGGGGGGA